jgi:hypothetical protein
MSLPAQVEEAAALAEELHGKMYGTEEEAVEETEEESTEEEVEETEEEEPEAVEEDETTEEQEDWQQKFEALEQTHKTLQGKYSAEVPRYAEEIRELKQLKSDVFERLGDVTQKVEAPEEKVVNEKEVKFREEYGDEFFETMKEMIQTEANTSVAEQIAPIKETADSTEEAQIKSAQKNFADHLNENINGDWMTLFRGEDTKFEAYLDQEDSSGLHTNRELMDGYNDSWNADRMVRLFNNYLGEPAPVEEKKPKANPVEEALIAPSRKTPHTTPNTEDKQMWTQDSLKQFEKDDMAGKYSSEESAALWQDLLSALAENRIQ